MSPPSFPITPEGLRGSWTFNALPPGRIDIGGFAVTAAGSPTRAGGRTDTASSDLSGSLAYLPDHAPVQGCSDEVRAMIRGVDVLLHDAQFLEARAPRRPTCSATRPWTRRSRWPHEANVGTLVLFHHSPVRTDTQLRRARPRAGGLDAGRPRRGGTENRYSS